MLLIPRSVRCFYGGLLDVSSLNVANATRMELLRIAFSTPFAVSHCFLSVSSVRCSQTFEKRQQSQIEREASELSKFIDSLCNPNAFKRRPDALFAPKRIGGMDVAADSFLDSLNLTEENISKEAISRFSKEVYKMSAIQLSQLLKATSNRKIEHPVLINHICTALKDRPLPPSLRHICQIAFYLSKHSFLDKPLLNRIKEDFLVYVRNEIISKTSFSHIVIAFAFFRLTDRHFWQQIIQITETLANRPEYSIALIECVNSLAVVNVHPKLVSSVIEKTKSLEKNGLFLGKWLQLVHSLAILNSLDSQMAESVLNRNFFERLSKTQKDKAISEHLVQWNSICYRNIAASARLELPKGEVPPIDGPFLADADPKSFSLVRDIKRGEQKHHPLLERFELMLRLVVPLNSHSTPQEWHKTGAFLEGRCFVDTAQRQLIPLRDVNGNPNVREVAVILLMDRHFTQRIGPSEEGPDRPTGINQMNIRHLKLAGIHPIVFTERHFRKLGDDERSQINFIREKILSLSEEFHTNEWAEEKDMLRCLFPRVGTDSHKDGL
ncbi:hypothetical protein niasHT_015778 [Heterodera trifolii]|uniref:Uncharacterized protein n=1 Tax=Heterodera trifolii TaxID=157864 RepID=A0ABD2L4L8_9BILA